MKLENYFRRFGIRNGSGAESSVSAVHLHYCRSADRLRPEHHRRSRKDRRYCKHHENRRLPFGKACTPHSSTEPSSLPMSQSSSSMPSPSKNRRQNQPHPDPRRPRLLHRRLPHRPARPADADPESVQHSRLPCNPGHSRAVCGAYDCDEV